MFKLMMPSKSCLATQTAQFQWNVNVKSLEWPIQSFMFQQCCSSQLPLVRQILLLGLFCETSVFELEDSAEVQTRGTLFYFT